MKTRSKIFRAQVGSSVALLCVATFAIGASQQTNPEFQKLYDHYFPKNAEGVESSIYRPAFDKLLSRRGPRNRDSRAAQLYYALQGDSQAYHAFMHNPDWSAGGAPGESCVYETVLLLIKLGDARFSELLAHEDASTRTKVGYAIDPHIDWAKHHFPKTRALYSYRYQRANR